LLFLIPGIASAQRTIPQRPLFPRLAPVAAPNAKLCVELPKPPGQLPAKPSKNYLRVAADGSVVGVSQGQLASIPEKTWGAGLTLRVRFSGGSAALRQRIRNVAELWRPHANVAFAWVDDAAPADIRVAFVAGDGSWSYIGRDASLIVAPAPTMNFGWFTDETTDEEIRRTAVHEFGHALGLIHEHQSPVAGIPWDVPKVYAWYSKNMGWDTAMVDANVLTKFAASTTNYSAYDATSIMQYPVPASLRIDKVDIGMNTQLSSMDKTAIRLWYPFPTVSKGRLHTGDDCDAIDFAITQGVLPGPAGLPKGLLLVRVGTGGPVNWWKSIKIPIVGNGQIEVQTGGIGAETRQTIPGVILDSSRPIRFAKAKFLGVHTDLGFTWDIMRALPEGSELQLTWVRDSCRQ
jgi:hypothetical protein